MSAGTPDGALALLEKSLHADILFTNVDLKGEIAAGIENSAFLAKPYTVEQLLTTLAVHFRISPQARRQPVNV